VLNAIQSDAIGIALAVMLLLFGAGQLAYPTLVPFWLKLIEGLSGIFRAPIVMPDMDLRSGNNRVDVKSLFERLSKLSKMLLPAIILCVPFVILILAGNAVMRNVTGDFMTQLFDRLGTIEPPSMPRMMLWAGLAIASLGLLAKCRPSTENFPRKDAFALPKDTSLAIWQTRFCLLMVNVLFLFVNWTDLSFLWGNKELPEGVNYSQFVHEGTWSLMVCALLAAAVLSLFFFQHRDICRARGVRILGSLWIAQNLILVAGVIFRVHLYINQWQLSLLRVYLLTTLILIIVGFLLLAIRIQFEKSFSWLVSANVVAIFLALLCLHAWDEHRYVAEYNYAAIENAPEDSKKLLDVKYLEKLGPSALPTLLKVGQKPELFGKKVTNKARTVVDLARKKSAKQKTDWRSIQFKPLQVLKSIGPMDKEFGWEVTNPHL